MEKNKASNFTTLGIPKDLAEELKIWKLAFSTTCGRTVTYEEMFRAMLDSLQKTAPAVFAAKKALMKTAAKSAAENTENA
jgi:hypothetical protein